MDYNRTPNHRTIRDLYASHREGKLDLAPKFQRHLVWNHKHKAKFIDTILQRFPFPEIYLATQLEDSTDAVGESITLVVDGQQRLDTIFNYIDGTSYGSGVKKYKELLDEERRNFLDYIVTTRDLGVVDNSTVREIFRRINTAQYSLNQIEINNAVYDGEYIGVAKKLAESDSYSKINPLSQIAISRMGDIEFILTIMTTLHTEIYFSGRKELDSYLEQYDDDYPAKEEVEEKLKRTFQLIADLDLPADSIWLKKANLFSLSVELTKKFDLALDKSQTKELSDLLKNLEKTMIENKDRDPKQDPYARYYYYTHQGTAGKLGREARGSLLESELQKLNF